MKRRGVCRLDRNRWVAGWTWAMPQTIKYRIPIRNGPAQLYYRRRSIDYALQPEPRLTAELLRRGFLESA